MAKITYHLWREECFAQETLFMLLPVLLSTVGPSKHWFCVCKLCCLSCGEQVRYLWCVAFVHDVNSCWSSAQSKQNVPEKKNPRISGSSHKQNKLNIRKTFFSRSIHVRILGYVAGDCYCVLCDKFNLFVSVLPLIILVCCWCSFLYRGLFSD